MKKTTAKRAAPKTCVLCEKGKLATGLVKMKRSVAGHVFVTRVSALKCDACGEAQIQGSELERFDLLVARDLLASKPDAEAFKFARKALGLTGKDLAALLDVTPESISRWETGKHAVDRRGWTLVGLMVDNRLAGSSATMDALRRAAKPTKLPDRVEVKVA
jgi:putative zinc finger/helix-turn-helix YgiT family protein